MAQGWGIVKLGWWGWGFLFSVSFCRIFVLWDRRRGFFGIGGGREIFYFRCHSVSFDRILAVGWPAGRLLALGRGRDFGIVGVWRRGWQWGGVIGMAGVAGCGFFGGAVIGGGFGVCVGGRGFFWVRRRDSARSWAAWSSRWAWSRRSCHCCSSCWRRCWRSWSFLGAAGLAVGFLLL